MTNVKLARRIKYVSLLFGAFTISFLLGIFFVLPFFDKKTNIELVSPKDEGIVRLGEEIWWNTSWSYRKEIIINHSKVAEDLVNFTVFVDIVSDDFVGHVQSDGDDFVFTNVSGFKLSHEIEFFDYDNGSLVAWVKVPFLSSDVDTVLYLYYGNPDCGSQQDVVGTWSGNGFRGVYHLGEGWSTASGHFKDSSGNNQHG
ncbi:MAG: DUF2341 domain-containing protein, partial [Candidatus Thermoplasmatota archaeon]|nr:DUF2341 domain-containing protein [Candidatus Thermoplasmatota archaeon]